GFAAGARDVRVHAGRPPRPVDLVPVRAGSEVLGVLAVDVPEGAFDEDGRRRALQHGSTVLALEMSKERASAEVERRLRGDLVEQLLAGGLEEDEAERLAHQAERLGRLAQQATAVVLKPGTVSAGVGNLAGSVAELARSHVEARQALRLSRRAGGRSRVTTYRSLGAFRLLLEVQSPEVLRGFVD